MTWLRFLGVVFLVLLALGYKFQVHHHFNTMILVGGGGFAVFLAILWLLARNN